MKHIPIAVGAGHIGRTGMKNLLLLCLAIFCSICAGESFSLPKIIKADGIDLAFREFLIEKSLNEADFKCEITQDTFENALKKLNSKQCDMILVKKTPQELSLAENLSCKVFAATPILIFVNTSNKISKLKISDLRQIWNNDINQWSFFNRSNIFSIHRFAMPYDDSAYAFLKRTLPLRDKAQHFPLNDSAQIIKMVSGNPNAIGICTFEKNLNLENINLIQLTDENGKNINLKIPHTLIFRSADKNKVENFLKVKKN